MELIINKVQYAVTDLNELRARLAQSASLNSRKFG